jgi:hypothetical protein
MAAAGELRVFTYPAAPGLSVPGIVYFAADGEGASGIQFELQYDASIIQVELSRGDGAIRSGKDLFVADLEPGKKRAIIIGSNQNTIEENVLVVLAIHVGRNVADGNYAIRLIEVVGVNPDGDAVPVGASGGVLTVAQRRHR